MFRRETITGSEYETCTYSYHYETTETTGVLRLSPGKSMPPAEFNFLGECPGPIDVVDVVCNPAMGMKVVEEALSLGIKAMWFQPGADDPEVVAKARDAGIETHCGCVLVDLPERREANL